MECPIQSREHAEVLLDYVNRTLEPDTAALLERHMEHCASCRQLAEAQRTVWAALDAWEATPVADDFDRRLYQRLEREGDGGWVRRMVEQVRPFSLKPAMPLAAAGVTLFAMFLLRTPDGGYVPPQRSETVDVEQVERSLEDLEMLRVLNVPAPPRQVPGNGKM